MVTTWSVVGTLEPAILSGAIQHGKAHRNKGVQEVEGLVYGGVGIDVALGHELVVDDSLQALGQIQGGLLQGVLLPLNGRRLLLHLDPVLLQVLVLPVTPHPTIRQLLLLMPTGS